MKQLIYKKNSILTEKEFIETVLIHNNICAVEVIRGDGIYKAYEKQTATKENLTEFLSSNSTDQKMYLNKKAQEELVSKINKDNERSDLEENFAIAAKQLYSTYGLSVSNLGSLLCSCLDEAEEEKQKVDWKINESKDFPLSVVEDTEGNDLVCEIGWERNKRNLRIANKIAATPELIRALEGCLGHVQNDEARGIAEAALAKAKGKSQ